MRTKDNKIDIQALLHLIKRRRWFIVIPLILASIGGYIRIVTLVSEYKSTATIVLGRNTFLTPEMQKVMPSIVARDKIKLRDKRETLTKKLKSHMLLTKVVDAIGNEASKGQVEKAKKLVERQGGDLTFENAKRGVMAASIRKKIGVEFPNRGDFIEISAVSKKPEEAYLIVKNLVAAFIEEAILSEYVGLKGTLDFSNTQLEVYRRKVTQAENALNRHRDNMSPESSADVTITLENIANVKKKRASYSKDISTRLKELSTIESQLGKYSSEIRIRQTDEATALIARLIEKNAELAKLMVDNTWNSGDAIRLNSQIAPLRVELAKTVKEKGASHLKGLFPADKIELAIRREILNRELAFLRIQHKTVSGLLATYNANSKLLPGFEVTVQKLQAELDKNQQLYQAFLEQVRSSKIRGAMKDLDKEIRYRVINPAQLPTDPITASTNQVILVALVMGLGFGGGFIYLLEFFDQSFKSVESVEDYLGLIVLGTVPRINFEERGNAKKRKASLVS